MHSWKQSSILVRSGFFLRQKQHSDRERPLRRQRYVRLFQEKGARDCAQYAHTITALAIGSHRATVRQAPQRCQRKTQDVVTRAAAQGRNKSDSARLVIEARIEKGSTLGAETTPSHIPLYGETLLVEK